MRPANERRYNVTLSLIGLPHAQNDHSVNAIMWKCDTTDWLIAGHTLTKGRSASMFDFDNAWPIVNSLEAAWNSSCFNRLIKTREGLILGCATSPEDSMPQVLCSFFSSQFSPGYWFHNLSDPTVSSRRQMSSSVKISSARHESSPYSLSCPSQQLSKIGLKGLFWFEILMKCFDLTYSGSRLPA